MLKKYMVKYPDLKNKTVLITGCGTGIGFGLIKAFLNCESKIIGIYRSKAPKIKNKNLTILKSDIGNIDFLSEWLNKFEKDGGKIDILINNAGVITDKKLIDTTNEDWINILDNNLKSTFFLSKLVAKHMIKKGGGIIINASSFASRIPSINYGLYAISKAGISQMTKIMAAELAPYNIRVNAYSPGVIETNMTKKTIKKNRKHMKEAISLNRFGSIKETSNAIMFLASEVSSYITGIDLDISGGKLLVQNPSKAYNKFL